MRCTMITSLLDAYRQGGFKPVQAAAGEWSGSCPACGGVDRFHIKGNRFICRKCGIHGDAIDFLKMFKGMSFRQAKQTLAAGSLARPSASPPDREEKSAGSMPHPKWLDTINGDLGLVQIFADHLHNDQGQSTLAYLTMMRGLSLKTIQDAQLGLIQHDLYFNRELFGLEAMTNSKGHPSKVKLAAGIVIPSINENGLIVGLRIRLTVPEKDVRYKILAGSCCVPMILNAGQPTVIVVESELDALLLAQIAGDVVTVIGLGSASIKPDSRTDALLRQADRILIALDNDRAGEEACQYWLSEYHHAKRLMPLDAKDPGEMFEHGVDLREWVKTGINNNSLTSNSITSTNISLSESEEERIAIMMHDAGLSESEAMQEIGVN